MNTPLSIYGAEEPEQPPTPAGEHLRREYKEGGLDDPPDLRVYRRAPRRNPELIQALVAVFDLGSG